MRSSASTAARSPSGRRRTSSTSRSSKPPTAGRSSRYPAPAARSCPRTTTTEMLGPLENEFMLRAIGEVALLGSAGAAIGCWVVLYRLSYAAESLAHSALPGVVIAAIIGVPLLLGGAPAVLIAALAIAAVARVPGVSREAGVGVVVTTMFGLGALLALSPDSPPGLQELLFGDILGVTDADLVAAAALVALVAAGLLLFHWRLLATGFDRASAGAIGAAPALTEAALLVLLALAIIVSIQGLGNLLV